MSTYKIIKSYITIQESVDNWDVKCTHALCKSRIKNPKKKANLLLIPKDAEKTIDRRECRKGEFLWVRKKWGKTELKGREWAYINQ